MFAPHFSPLLFGDFVLPEQVADKVVFANVVGEIVKSLDAVLRALAG